jgi:hypothetical protein
LRPDPRLGDAARLTPHDEDLLTKRWYRQHKQATTSPVQGDPSVPTQPGVAKPGPPSNPIPSLPPLPPAPEPEEGTIGYLDRAAGGRPYLIYVNGREEGWAWILPENGPYLSLGAFNDLFHRTLYWVPITENRVRILNSSFAVETTDVQVQRNRLWLRLTPTLQHDLAITLDQMADGRLFFHSGD